MGRPAAPLSNKKAYGAATAREGIPAASVLRFLPKGKACPQYAGPPRKGAFRKPFTGHSQDTRKAPGTCRGLFLLRVLSIKKDTESTVQAAQPATRRTTFFLWLCHSIWLLHLYNTVKMQTFSQDFPLAESIAKAFCRLSLWNFKEKSINHFL